jgi:hypothetical protein
VTATPTETATPTVTATVTATITLSPTPTPTNSPVGARHYECYETHRLGRVGISGLTLTDDFLGQGPSTAHLRQLKRLCTPASKNGEDPGAPADPDHLTGYTLDQDSPPFKHVFGLSVSNQFGDTFVDLVRPDMLLVPAAKSLVAAPGSFAPAINHFECYRIERARFRASGVTIDDQFGHIVEDIKKPTRFCNAVTKTDQNGVSPVVDPSNTHLLCYRVRAPSGAPTSSKVFILNQFGTDSFNLFGARELCVPSTVVAPD